MSGATSSADELNTMKSAVLETEYARLKQLDEQSNKYRVVLLKDSGNISVRPQILSPKVSSLSGSSSKQDFLLDSGAKPKAVFMTDVRGGNATPNCEAQPPDS